MKYILCGLLFLFAASSVAWAQTANAYRWVLPRESPKASVSQTIGVTTVDVSYHRPSVNGRPILGELVPYGEVWRAGANEATTIAFSTDVSIAGEKLPKGKYAFFVIPKQDGTWTLIFNKAAEQWGAYTYKPDDDALKVDVRGQTVAHVQDDLMYTFEEVAPHSGSLVLAWSTFRVPIPIEVDLSATAMQRADESFSWRSAFFAADYFLSELDDAQQAQKWGQIAISMEKNVSTLELMSRVAKANGQADQAKSYIQEAISLAEASTSPNRDSLIKWLKDKEANLLSD